MGAKRLTVESLRRRARQVRLLAMDFDGVLTDNTVYVFQDGREAVRCWRGDGLGLAKLKPLGIETIIISTEVNPVVSARARKLGVPCVQGCADKMDALDSVLRQKTLTLSQVAFVGNDTNDLCCLTSVGLPIVTADAHPDVVEYAAYQTHARGGRGAIREVCDLFAQLLAKNRGPGGSQG